MRSTLKWPQLLDRLERDLERRSSTGGTRDDQAWEEMRDRLYRCAMMVNARLRLSREELEEVVQDILLRLQSPDALRRLRLAGSQEGYLFVVVRNHVFDVGRRLGRELHRLVPLADDVASAHVAPESPEQDETAPALHRELQRLSKEERRLLSLRFWEGLSIAEIARKDREPYSRVAVRLFRLLRRLRDRLVGSSSAR